MSDPVGRLAAPGEGALRGNRALVVSSLVSSIYVRLRSSVFAPTDWRRSRTLTVFGELLSQVLKIGRSAVNRLHVGRYGEAPITPYITHTIRRLGDLVLDLDPPNAVPTTRLDLQPRVLFPGGPAA